MECFKIDDLTASDFKEIKHLNKAEKLRFASKFLPDLHDKFLDVLRFSNEALESTPCRSNNKRNEATSNTSLNGSFLTSTPDSKGRKNFHPNKIHGLSPFSPPPSFDQRIDRQGRSKACLGDFYQKNVSDNRPRHRNKNGPRTGSNAKFQPVPKFNLNANEFPSISESTKPKRRLSTTVVSGGKEEEMHLAFGSNPFEVAKDQNQAFEKPTIIPAPASAMPRSLWAKPPPEVLDSSYSTQHSNSGKPLERNLHLPHQPMKSKMTKVHDSRIDDVTNVDELNHLADLYSHLINEGLTPSVMNELYTVVQLLTSNIDAEKWRTAGGKYFSSPSNVVYFSCRVLQNISSWLELLNHEALKLLSENKRLKMFASDLVQNISELVSISSQEDLIEDEIILSGGINFDEDIDTRSNFPSNNAFNIFKKQRDMFYQLLREWEKEHLSIGWSMKMKVDTIRTILIGCQPTLTDQLRFVRLFVSQLIKTCCSGKTNKDNSQLTELKTADPDKLKRLQGRLAGSPSSDANPCFSKSEEFFRDFISLSSDNSFHVLLVDAIYAKIEDVSESTVNLVHDSSSNCDTSSTSFQSGFLNEIVTLQILGKFLGFVTFLPYRTDENLTQFDESALVAMRNRLPERVGVLCVLKQHLHRGSLVIGLSWSLNHLSLMDNIATRLQTTINVFEFLVAIYHSSFDVFSNSKSKIFVLVSNMLGWFFELDLFPKGLLFSNFKTLDSIELERLKVSLDHNINISREVISRCQPLHSGRIQYVLQHCDVPHRSEQRGKHPTRKINPKSAPLNSINHLSCNLKEEISATSDVKKKLEVSFFEMHSASLKRSVEFVCERIFSSWVLVFQNRQIKSHMKKAQIFARDIAASLSEGFDKKCLISVISKKAEELKHDLVFGEDSMLDSFCERAQLILANLLPESTVPQVLSISTNICCKNIKEKAFDWKRGNLSPDTFTKEIASELNKQFQLHDHLSDHVVLLSRQNKSFTNSEDVIEIIRTGGNRETCCSPANPGVESFNRSGRSVDSKVFNRSFVEIRDDCDDDDDDDINKSMNNHSMLFALNASESHFNDPNVSLQENPEKEDKAPIKRRGCESQTRVCKIEEEEDEVLLPSEVIVSVQDLLVSLSMRSVESRSEIKRVLCRVKRVLEDPYKLLHEQARTLLHSLTISLALTIIREAEMLWDDHLEEELVSVWRGEVDPDEFEELFHAAKTIESSILQTILKRLHKAGIIIRID